jgi:hypothetical protein
LAVPLTQTFDLYFHWSLNKFKPGIAFLKYRRRSGNEIFGNPNLGAVAQRHKCKRAGSRHQLSATDKRERETASPIPRQVHVVTGLCAVGKSLVDME